jgi:hypothetical protein
MKKNYGKNEAGYNYKKKTVITIVSMIAVTLLIGMAVQPAIAGPESTVGTKSQANNQGPKCKTCSEAAAFAVDYMVDHVKANINETYFLWTVDATILIFQGLVLGYKESGFTIEINEVALKAKIYYWVVKIVGPQLFNITKFLAGLSAIAIGITEYLLTLCDGGSRNITYNNARLPGFISRSILRIFKKIIRLQLFGQ